MIRRPPRSTRTDTLFPYTTLFRSDLVGVLVELTAGMQLGHDDLRRRHALLAVEVDRDAAAVVRHRDRAVAVQGDPDRVAPAGQRLVDGVVDPLVDPVVQAGAGRSEERRVGKEGVSTVRSRWSPAP